MTDDRQICKVEKKLDQKGFEKGDPSRLIEMSEDLKRILGTTHKFVLGEIHIRKESDRPARRRQ